MGFNSAFKGLNQNHVLFVLYLKLLVYISGVVGMKSKGKIVHELIRKQAFATRRNGGGIHLKFTLKQATKFQSVSRDVALSLISALDGVGAQRNPRPLYSREGHGTHCIGGWIDLRASLDGW